jgi:hypothetical protein
MLNDREARLRDRGAFIKTTALSADVRINVPVVFVAAVETFLCPILRVAELAHLREGLYLLTEHIAELVGIRSRVIATLAPLFAAPAFAGVSDYLFTRLCGAGGFGIA